MARTIPREVSKEDIGWLAGIIDGEGSICIVKPKKVVSNRLLYGVYIVGGDLSLMTKSVSIINKLATEGKPIVLQPKKYKTGIFKTNKEMYQLCIRKQSTIVNVLDACLPHLTEKKPKALKLLNFLKNHKVGARFKEGEVEQYLLFTPVETKRTAPKG